MRRSNLGVIVTGVVLAIGGVLVLGIQHLGGLYVSPAILSVVPLASLLYTAPALAGLACLTAYWYCDRNSPLASPVATRAAGGQALREFGRFAVPVLLSFTAAALIVPPILATRATGGELDWVRMATAPVGLLLVKALGFFLGLAIARWWAILLSIVLGAAMAFAPQLLMSGLSGRNGFSGEMAPLAFSVIGGQLTQRGAVSPAWWGMEALVLAAGLLGVMAIFTWQRMAAGYGRLPAITSLGGCVVALAVLVLWGSRCPRVTAFYEVDEVVCSSTTAGTEVCLAAEEAPLLSEAVEDVNAVEEQLQTGGGEGFSSYLPVDMPSHGYHFSPGEQEQTRFEIAASYTGLNQCKPGASLDFSHALTLWAMQDQETIDNLAEDMYTENIYIRMLFSAPDSEVVGLYHEHRDEILNCEYAPQLEQ
ncbi:hypothetical protein [Actinobaculum sp. 352]|uniref:hypothetical protein n=1 Tax=Actinobaculum sp. 352 TaxID=2490946 RepID=UPI000F7F9F37|nr:hypothetical protein [Actinobaculum sp. 352]RTE48264.1 hypothetical protein EKN07_10240 [Actinobaculum sp. 352]